MDSHLLSDIILLPLFWLIAFLFLSGLGYASASLLSSRPASRPGIYTCFWFGLGMCIGFLQVWNLFLPVTFYFWLCFMPVAALGINGLVRYGGLIQPGKTLFLSVLSLFAILIYQILASLDNSFIYDSLVYHFYTLKWLDEYPVVPGMGNLFVYLGLNQSYFLYPAFLNSVWDGYKGACAANGLLVMVVCAEIITVNTPVFRGNMKPGFLFFFQLLFLPFCIVSGLGNLSSPTPDVFVNLLTFKTLSDLISYIESKDKDFTKLFFIGFYCLLGLIMKLSFAGIALGVFPVLIYLLFVQRIFSRDSFLKSMVFFLFLSIPWLIRGIIANGYIGFPISAFGIPVDWKMPEVILNNFSDYIKGFARSHLHGPDAGRAAHDYSWLAGWVERMLGTMGFILSLLAFIASMIVLKIKKVSLANLSLVVIPLYIAILFWFFTAPDIRFASFTFWALGITPLGFLLSRLLADCRKVFTAVICLVAIVMMSRSVNTEFNVLGDLPMVEKSVFTTKSGLKINIVKNSAGTDDWRISDCIIPCSVFPDSNLVLRKENINGGFQISQK